MIKQAKDKKMGSEDSENKKSKKKLKRYLIPELGRVVEASSLEEARRKVEDKPKNDN